MNRLKFRHFIIVGFIVLSVWQVSAQNSVQFPKDSASGFPGGYEEKPKCVTTRDVASFDKVFIRADMSPAIKATLTKALNDYGVIKIVSDSEEADFLIDISETSGNATLKLWALATRPRQNRDGVRCNILPGKEPSSKLLIDELINYFKEVRITAKIEKDAESDKLNDGFPSGKEKPKPIRAKGDVIIAQKDPKTGFPIDLYPDGVYFSKFGECRKEVSEDELRTFSKVFISNSIPTEQKAKITKALNETGIVTVVDDSLKADYLLDISNYIGTRSETGATFELSKVSILVIKHPKFRGYQGFTCKLYEKQASRAEGRIVQVLTKNPIDRLIKDLVKFFGRYSDKKN